MYTERTGGSLATQLMKHYFIIVAIVLMLGGVLVSYEWTADTRNTPSLVTGTTTPLTAPRPAVKDGEETIPWLTYRNEKYGFEVGYIAHQPFYAIDKMGDSITNSKIIISLPVSEDVGYNPHAETLADYKKTYSTQKVFSTTNTGEPLGRVVLIHEQEETIINNIPALKQIYSTGNVIAMSANREGTALVPDRNDTAENYSLRYIFFKDKKVLILKMTHVDDTLSIFKDMTRSQKNKLDAAEEELNVVAQTFKFTQ